MGYWAKPGLDRHQTRLFTPTLDQCVGDNHPVRHLDEILRGRDWSDWTAQYNGRVGQPPIPPWVMAGVILGILEVRRFLLRGLEKVRTEWMWVCTAYNLKKLIAVLAALRAESDQMPAWSRS